MRICCAVCKFSRVHCVSLVCFRKRTHSQMPRGVRVFVCALCVLCVSCVCLRKRTHTQMPCGVRVLVCAVCVLCVSVQAHACANAVRCASSVLLLCVRSGPGRPGAAVGHFVITGLISTSTRSGPGRPGAETVPFLVTGPISRSTRSGSVRPGSGSGKGLHQDTTSFCTHTMIFRAKTFNHENSNKYQHDDNYAKI